MLALSNQCMIIKARSSVPILIVMFEANRLFKRKMQLQLYATLCFILFVKHSNLFVYRISVYI